MGNLSLGLHSADLANFGEQQTQSLVVSPKFTKNHESQTENPSVVDSAQSAESSKKFQSKKPFKSFCYFWLSPKVESLLPLNHNLPNNADSADSQNLGKNSTKNAESNKNSPSLAEGARGWVKTPSLQANPQNLNQNNPCEAPENSPASWCKKSESKGAVVPPADFLLEAEKRGSPPKSEKRQLLARRGSGVGGAALLRKEKSEIDKKNSGKIAESNIDSANSADSAILSQSGLPRSHSLARNDEFNRLPREQSSLAMTENRDFAESSLDSAPSTHEANSAIAGEFLGNFVKLKLEASDKDRTQVHRGSEPKRSLKSRCESKFALDSTLLQNQFFPAKKSSHFAESRAKFLPNTALIALGANLKNPIHTFKSLFTKLARNAKIHILATSPIYKNPPFGFRNQPFFYNATALLATKMCLLEFYAFIFYLERIFGRTRKRAFKNAPRALDIDIIFFNDIFMRSAKLNIPHPHWRNRPSVVVPLLFQVNYKGF